MLVVSRGGFEDLVSQKESYLDEANVGGLLTEALTADVEAVLADQTGLVGADAAVREVKIIMLAQILQFPSRKFLRCRSFGASYSHSNQNQSSKTYH
jgi:hypothetical protein